MTLRRFLVVALRTVLLAVGRAPRGLGGPGGWSA